MAAKAGVNVAGRSTEQFRNAYDDCVASLMSSDVPDKVKTLTRRVLDCSQQITVMTAAKKARKESKTTSSTGFHSRHRLVKREHAQLKVLLEKELRSCGLLDPR